MKNFFWGGGKGKSFSSPPPAKKNKEAMDKKENLPDASKSNKQPIPILAFSFNLSFSPKYFEKIMETALYQIVLTIYSTNVLVMMSNIHHCAACGCIRTLTAVAFILQLLLKQIFQLFQGLQLGCNSSLLFFIIFTPPTRLRLFLLTRKEGSH